MKFEIIDNRELDLKGKGYKWSDAPLQYDKTVLDDIRRTRGENYADDLSDNLFDGYSPIWPRRRRRAVLRALRLRRRRSAPGVLVQGGSQ